MNIVITDSDREYARRLIAKGWRSVSNRWRVLARLPDGMTGREALRWGMIEYQRYYGGKVEGFNGRDKPLEARPLSAHTEEWIQLLDEESAGGHFMRVYSMYDYAKPFSLELTIPQFRAFKLEGGVSAR